MWTSQEIKSCHVARTAEGPVVVCQRGNRSYRMDLPTVMVDTSETRKILADVETCKEIIELTQSVGKAAHGRRDRTRLDSARQTYHRFVARYADLCKALWATYGVTFHEITSNDYEALKRRGKSYYQITIDQANPLGMV